MQVSFYGHVRQYRGLQAEFGAARVIDTPISESTIMGAAVGMALAGLHPVVRSLPPHTPARRPREASPPRLAPIFCSVNRGVAAAPRR